MGEYDRAVPNLERALKLQPDFVDAYLELHSIKLLRNNVIEAENEIEKLKRLGPSEDPSIRIHIARLLALQGKKEEALSLSKSPSVYVILGMYEQAIDKLKTWHFPYLTLKNYPPYQKLKEEPEFQELLRNAEYEYNGDIKRFPFEMD